MSDIGPIIRRRGQRITLAPVAPLHDAEPEAPPLWPADDEVTDVWARRADEDGGGWDEDERELR